MYFRLPQVVVQTAAADRVRAGPTDAQALVRIRAAVALPHEERPIGLRLVRSKVDLRYLHREVVAQRIGEGRRQFVAQAQRQRQLGSDLPGVVDKRMEDVALEFRIGNGGGICGDEEFAQQEFGEGVATASI